MVTIGTQEAKERKWKSMGHLLKTRESIGLPRDKLSTPDLVATASLEL